MVINCKRRTLANCPVLYLLQNWKRAGKQTRSTSFHFTEVVSWLKLIQSFPSDKQRHLIHTEDVFTYSKQIWLTKTKWRDEFEVCCLISKSLWFRIFMTQTRRVCRVVQAMWFLCRLYSCQWTNNLMFEPIVLATETLKFLQNSCLQAQSANFPAWWHTFKFHPDWMNEWMQVTGWIKVCIQ